LYALTVLGSLKSCGGGHHVSHSCTLKGKPVGQAQGFEGVTTREIDLSY